MTLPLVGTEAAIIKQCIEIVCAPVEYQHSMPCPTASPGCLVSHTVAWKRPKTATEIEKDLRLLLGTFK